MTSGNAGGMPGMLRSLILLAALATSTFAHLSPAEAKIAPNTVVRVEGGQVRGDRKSVV